MNEYPVAPTTPFQGLTVFLNDICRLRREDVREIRNLNNQLVQGRLRNDRPVPTSHSDVTVTDKEGDIVRSATYEYLLVNDAGTLKWGRHAIDVTW